MTSLQLKEYKVSYWLVPDLFRYKGKNIVVHTSFIEGLVIKEFRITYGELIGGTRTLQIARARHLVFYLMSLYTNLHLRQIGSLMGGRHHSTVIYGIRSIKDAIETEPDFAKIVKRIEQKII